MKQCFACLLMLSLPLEVEAEDGYDVWLRYRQIGEEGMLEAYRQFNEPDSPGAVSLAATSGYRCPTVIQRIAGALEEPMLAKERRSINIADAPKYGLLFERIEDGHLYWSIQDYVHPSIIDLSTRMSEEFGVRQFEDYGKYAAQYEKQIEEYGRIVNPDLCHKALTEVHIHTYRTADYLLSCRCSR